MKTNKHFLFCPGPVNIAQNVKDSVNNEIGHRETEFSLLLASINKKLLKALEIEKPNLYHPILLTGSGTAVNESVLSSIGDVKLLVLSNGEFGDRLYEISKIHNKNTHILRFGWAKDFNLKEIEKFVKKNSIEMLVMTHHETSTGMLNPVEKVGKLAKKHKLLFFVDSISGIGAEKLNVEKSNITFLSGTSGKAIGSLPGVGFVLGKKEAFERLSTVPAKTMYLNLYKIYTYSKNLLQTPNTPAVQLFYATEQALENILSEGLKTRYRRINKTTEALRSGMEKLGLKFLLHRNQMSNVLTTVRLPKYIDMITLRHELKKKNIIIYNGKGVLENKYFQVGNIGAIDIENVNFFLESLKEILKTAKKNEASKKINSEIKIKNNRISKNSTINHI